MPRLCEPKVNKFLDICCKVVDPPVNTPDRIPGCCTHDAKDMFVAWWVQRYERSCDLDWMRASQELSECPRHSTYRTRSCFPCFPDSSNATTRCVGIKKNTSRRHGFPSVDKLCVEGSNDGACHLIVGSCTLPDRRRHRNASSASADSPSVATNATPDTSLRRGPWCNIIGIICCRTSQRHFLMPKRGSRQGQVAALTCCVRQSPRRI